jgi:hypothetical protein
MKNMKHEKYNVLFLVDISPEIPRYLCLSRDTVLYLSRDTVLISPETLCCISPETLCRVTEIAEAVSLVTRHSPI